jgi:hypothetical protein
MNKFAKTMFQAWDIDADIYVLERSQNAVHVHNVFISYYRHSIRISSTVNIGIYIGDNYKDSIECYSDPSPLSNHN